MLSKSEPLSRVHERRGGAELGFGEGENGGISHSTTEPQERPGPKRGGYLHMLRRVCTFLLRGW